MGQESLSTNGINDRPVEAKPDLRVAARNVRLEIGDRRPGDSRPVGARGEDPDAASSQEADTRGISELGTDAVANLSPAKARRAAMRRILPRTDQVRLALGALSEAVREAESQGIDRAAIVEAIRIDMNWEAHCHTLAASADLLSAIGHPIEYDVIRLDETPISSNPMRLEAAQRDGAYAEVTGHGLDACPYTSNQPDMRLKWRRGWNDSRGNRSE